METKEALMKKMSDCVFEMEDEEVVDVVKEYIAVSYTHLDVYKRQGKRRRDLHSWR